MTKLADWDSLPVFADDGVPDMYVVRELDRILLNMNTYYYVNLDLERRLPYALKAAETVGVRRIPEVPHIPNNVAGKAFHEAQNLLADYQENGVYDPERVADLRTRVAAMKQAIDGTLETLDTLDMIVAVEANA